MGNEAEKFKLLQNMLGQVDGGAGSQDVQNWLQGSGGPGLESTAGTSTHDAEMALESLDLLRSGDQAAIGPEQRFVLEAIVMPYHRPVVDIVENRMQQSQ